MLAGEWPDQQHGAWGMVQNKPCDVPDRFRPDCWLLIVFGAGIDDNQVSSPLGRSVDYLTLRPALAFQGFRSGKAAHAFIQNFACGSGFSLPHLLLA